LLASRFSARSREHLLTRVSDARFLRVGVEWEVQVMRTSMYMMVATLVGASLAGDALPVRAQVTNGSIVGTVTDASGQVVPGAQVTIRDIQKNTTTNLVTDTAGTYEAPFLVPGRLK
jgi:hypothetical protein